MTLSEGTGRYMNMEEMTDDEIRTLLDHARVAHVGLARDGDAYVIPVFFAYDGEQLWFHSHPGLKRDYLDATGEACATVTVVETEEVWASVQILGPVAEATMNDDRKRAMEALMSRPSPPHREGDDPEELFYWHLTPNQISGRKSVRPREPDMFDIQ